MKEEFFNKSVLLYAGKSTVSVFVCNFIHKINVWEGREKVPDGQRVQ